MSFDALYIITIIVQLAYSFFERFAMLLERRTEYHNPAMHVLRERFNSGRFLRLTKGCDKIFVIRQNWESFTSKRSDVIVDRPGLLDCVKEGFLRISSDIMGSRDTRRIPIWNLIGPSVVYRLSHYVLSSITRYTIHSVVKKQIINKPSQERTLFDDFFPDLFASFASCLAADAILFPLETILHRLYLQGLRTIVDNLDSGASVIPITTRYEGFFDCIRSIARDEGFSGFYKGFGALLLQYALHMLVLRVLRLLFEQLEESRRGNAGQQASIQSSMKIGPVPTSPFNFAEAKSRNL